jgi:hypothetical protein
MPLGNEPAVKTLLEISAITGLEGISQNSSLRGARPRNQYSRVENLQIDLLFLTLLP